MSSPTAPRSSTAAINGKTTLMDRDGIGTR
jgi:hypothetical protein